MRQIPLAASALISMLLTACADWQGISGQSTVKDTNRLALTETTGPALPAAPWPAGEWWTVYGDEQLDRLIGEGLANSPTLGMAAARMRQAAAAAGIADSRLYPSLDGSAQITRERFTENGVYPAPFAGNTRTSNRLALEGFYSIDLWGGKEAEYQAALGRLRVSEIEAQAARLDLAAAIARTYAQLAAEFDQLDIDRDLLRQKQDIKALSEKLMGAGLLTNVENQQAAAAISATQAEIAESEERIALLRQKLAVLAGAGPDRGQAIARPRLAAVRDVGLPSAIPAELIGRRPDIVAQRWRIEAAGQSVAAARTQFYPNVDLSAFLGFEAIGIDQFLKTSSHVAGIGPAVTLPIFEGGRLRSALAQTQAERDIAIEQYNAAIVAAVQDVVGQLTSWRSNQAALDRERLAVSHLEEAYRLALLRYREGLTGYLTVLSAEGDLIAQRRREAASRNRQTDISMALAHALGGGFVPGNVPSL